MLKKMISRITLLSTFDEQDEMSLFLILFESQMRLLRITIDLWVIYLVGVLPNKIGKLIEYEPDEKFQD